MKSPPYHHNVSNYEIFKYTSSIRTTNIAGDTGVYSWWTLPVHQGVRWLGQVLGQVQGHALPTRPTTPSSLTSTATPASSAVQHPLRLMSSVPSLSLPLPHLPQLPPHSTIILPPQPHLLSSRLLLPVYKELSKGEPRECGTSKETRRQLQVRPRGVRWNL